MSKGSSERSEHGTQAVARALAILDAFSIERPVLTATQLCQLLGLNKSTVHRLTGILETRGLLWRDAKTRTYALGSHLFGLAEVASNRRDLTSVCMPHMVRLTEETGETTGIHIRVGGARICIAQVESRHELTAKLELGKPLPLYCGAASKALIARLPDKEIEELIKTTGLKPIGPGSITNPELFKAELKAVQKSGYSISREERTQGGITIAVAILDKMDGPIAALSVYAPTVRVSKQTIKSWAPSLLAAAQDISSRLSVPGRVSEMQRRSISSRRDDRSKSRGFDDVKHVT